MVVLLVVGDVVLVDVLVFQCYFFGFGQLLCGFVKQVGCGDEFVRFFVGCWLCLEFEYFVVGLGWVQIVYLVVGG